MYAGEERRLSQDEQLGYIRGKMESMDRKLSDHMESEEGTITELKAEIAAIRKELNVYRFMWMSVKTFAVALFSVLLVVFDDIIELFRGIG